jgi:hypothetical protein
MFDRSNSIFGQRFVEIKCNFVSRAFVHSIQLLRTTLLSRYSPTLAQQRRKQRKQKKPLALI